MVIRTTVCAALLLLSGVGGVAAQEGKPGAAARVPRVLPTEIFTGKVTRVLSGDTIEVEHDKNRRRIRLSGIDAPEPGQPYAPEARKRLEASLRDRRVRVEMRSVDTKGRHAGEVFVLDTPNPPGFPGIPPDPSGVATDPTGVSNPSVKVDTVRAPEITINKAMLQAGLAWHRAGGLTPAADKEYARLQEEARTARQGLWASPNPVAPWTFNAPKPPRR